MMMTVERRIAQKSPRVEKHLVSFRIIFLTFSPSSKERDHLGPTRNGPNAGNVLLSVLTYWYYHTYKMKSELYRRGLN